jgi:hypothetical protein
LEDSFYCGDAAGRKSDFSSDDLLFALNTGLKFYTPEMLFKNEERNYKVVKGLKVPGEESKKSKPKLSSK